MSGGELAAAVALAGGIGAISRYLLDATIQRKLLRQFPLGTLGVNVIGSFVLGLIAGLVAHHGAPTDARVVLGVGFCGGLTTFSAASFESIRLLREQLLLPALAVAFGGVITSLLAASLGLGLALI